MSQFEERDAESFDEAMQVVQILEKQAFEARDYEFLAKMIVTILTVFTRSLHNDEPHEGHFGPCPHAETIGNYISQALAEGVSMGWYGPSELTALVKASSFAAAVGMNLAGIQMSPGDVLAQVADSFSPASWDRIRDAVLEDVIEAREVYSEGAEEILTREEMQDMLDKLGSGEVDIEAEMKKLLGEEDDEA
jgi:hypothetical protein